MPSNYKTFSACLNDISNVYYAIKYFEVVLK